MYNVGAERNAPHLQVLNAEKLLLGYNSEKREFKIEGQDIIGILFYSSTGKKLMDRGGGTR